MSPSEEKQRSRVTRKDRAINDEEWIVDFLSKAGAGTIATAQDNQPFLSTLLFVYDPQKHAIYLHAARRGRLWENIPANPRTCFTAFQMGRLLPADTALEFSVEYESVVAFGSLCLVEDPAEAEHGLQLTLDKYAPHLRPGRDYRPITPTELQATAVYRLDIEEWSAKRKNVPGEFPGSYLWSERPAA